MKTPCTGWGRAYRKGGEGMVLLSRLHAVANLKGRQEE